METLVKKLNQSMKAYETLQEKQLSLFDTTLIPDLELLNFERASAFTELKINLDHFLNIIHRGDDLVDLISVYQTRINTILKTDDLLKEKINHHKNEMKQHIADTNKNKVAFQGYANSTRASHLKTISFSG